MPRSYGGYRYNISDDGLANIIHARAAAFYTIREHLPRLYEWSTSEGIGAYFRTVCWEHETTVRQAKSRRAAALALRGHLLQRLSALTVSGPEKQLRDEMVAALTSAGTKVNDPLSQIFSYVADQCSGWFGADWPLGTEILVEASRRAPYGPGCTLYVNAETEPATTNPIAAPVVHLRLWPERLNGETYGAIMAVLVHEMVCHVPARGGPTPASSEFAEGFSDWAARKLFERWLGGVDPLLVDAARWFGRMVWDVGMAPGGGNAYFRERRFGHDAAEHVVTAFRTGTEKLPEAVAVDKTMILARELTVYDAPIRDKDRFVLNLAVVRGTIAERLERWGRGECEISELLLPLH